jgi:hypothetical protein
MSSFTQLSNSGLVNSASGIFSNTGYSALPSASPSYANSTQFNGYFNTGSFGGQIANGSGLYAANSGLAVEAPRRSILRSRSVDQAALSSASFEAHQSNNFATSAIASASAVRGTGSSFNINQVPLNQDPNPIVVRRKPAQPVRYQQNVSVKVRNLKQEKNI